MKGPSAGDLSRMLADRALALCIELLPNGRRDGQEWVHPSLTGSSPRSMSVHLSGPKAGVWCEFDSGAKGDAFDLVAFVRFNGDKSAAYRWSLAFLGFTSGGSLPAPTPPPQRAASEPGVEVEQNRRRALGLFLQAQERLSKTPVAAYLAGRGIDLAALGRQPRSLRFHPRLFNREVGSPLPGMVAAIVAPNGQHLATHRTWLAPCDAQGWRKAPLCNAKMTLGSYAGGTIRLWRGASTKRLADAPESDTTVICEGIETGLSVALACPDLRVLAAVSLSNLGRVILPRNVIDIIVAADNDPGNPASEQQLDQAVTRLLSEGRSVRIARSSVGSDFNDALQVIAA